LTPEDVETCTNYPVYIRLLSLTVISVPLSCKKYQQTGKILMVHDECCCSSR